MRAALATGFCIGCAAMAGENAMKISVREETMSGERAVILENSFFKSVIIPGKAMFPATYFYKPSGHDVFFRRETMEQSFLSLDGFFDCLPWVGDSRKRGASKGLLKTAAWQTDARVDGGVATLAFRTVISYPDFTTGRTTELAFAKTMVASEKHAQLRMDYEIENKGRDKARFIMVGHARVAAGGKYDRGDYIYAPGTNCWVTEFKWPALDKLGVKPYSWTPWPIEGVVDFAPKEGPEKKGDSVYAFVPASWSVIGDEKSREYVLFHYSPVQLGKAIMRQPFACILHRDNDYLLEISLSRDIDAKNWDEPWATASLAPGEKAQFTVYMTPGQGLVKADFEKVTQVTPDRLVIGGASGREIKLAD